MKYISAVLFFCCGLIAAYGDSESGTVVNIKGSEVVVRYFDMDHPFQAGDLLYAATRKGPLTLKVVFPMQATARCICIVGSADGLNTGDKVRRTPYEPQKTQPERSAGLPGIEKGRALFRFNGDGTVTQNNSGLMWTMDANALSSDVDYSDARDFEEKCSIGGYRNWRIPTKQELEILLNTIPREVLEKGKGAEWLTAVGFRNVQSDMYWSSTYQHILGIGTSTTRYSQLLFTNGENGTGTEVASAFLWLVRSAVGGAERKKLN